MPLLSPWSTLRGVSCLKDKRHPSTLRVCTRLGEVSFVLPANIGNMVGLAIQTCSINIVFQALFFVLTGNQAYESVNLAKAHRPGA